MSNVNRAVTRTRRAAGSRKRSGMGAVPWPGPARYKAPVAPYTQPPRMTRQPATRPRRTQAAPMRPGRRVRLYRLQNDAACPLDPLGQPLTPAQARRARHKARRQGRGADLVSALGVSPW